MSKKNEIILNEIGKATVEELLQNDMPFNIFNFLDTYFSKISKHPNKTELLKYIRKYDLNFRYLLELLESTSYYFREGKDIIISAIQEAEDNYPINEKFYKKSLDNFSKSIKKSILSKSSDEENWQKIFKELFLSITKFIKKNFHSEDTDVKLYEIEKKLKSYKSINDYKSLIKELENILNNSVKSKGKSSGSSFLSSFFGKSSAEDNIEDSLKDIIKIFVKNIEGFWEFDKKIQHKVKDLTEKVNQLNSLEEVEEFKKILKEIFFKLEFLKNSIEQEKNELKNIIILMADSFKKFVGDSSDYAKHLDEFVEKIKKTDDIDEIKKIKIEIIKATISLKEKTDTIKQELIQANEQIINARERLERLEKELEKTKEKALYDGLTKAYNRAVFDDRIAKEVLKANRDNKPLYLLMLDIDHFKSINDNYGHQTGDMVLKILTQQIQKVIRDVDFFARYGGEEFAVLLPDIPLERAKEVAERIRKKIEKTKFMYKNEPIKVTISIGMAKLEKGENVKEFIKRADDALYKAKKTGRNKVVLA